MPVLPVVLHVLPGREEGGAEAALVHLVITVSHGQVHLHVVLAREHLLALRAREADAGHPLGHTVTHLLVPGQGGLVHELALAARTDVGHDGGLTA